MNKFNNYHEISGLCVSSLQGSNVKRKLFQYIKKHKTKFLFRFFGIPQIPQETIKILDIGCGSGYQLLTLKEIYPHLELYGIDIVKTEDLSEIINFSTVNLEKDNLPFEQESFDFIMCRGVIEHVNNPSKIFAEAYRVLKKGGKFHVLTENWTSIFIPPTSIKLTRYGTNFYDDYTHIRPYTKKSLYRFFVSVGFKDISIKVERNLFIILALPLLLIMQLTKKFDIGRLLYEIFGCDLFGEARK